MEQAAMPRMCEPNCEFKGLSGQFTARDMLLGMRQQLELWDISADQIENVQIAMAEALNNVAEHAYGFRDGYPIVLRVSHDETCLKCVIVDSGAPIPNDELPPGVLAQVGDTLEDLPEGGFGWFLIRTLADSILYDRDEGQNRLEIHFPLQ